MVCRTDTPHLVYIVVDEENTLRVGVERKLDRRGTTAYAYLAVSVDPETEVERKFWIRARSAPAAMNAA